GEYEREESHGAPGFGGGPDCTLRRRPAVQSSVSTGGTHMSTDPDSDTFRPPAVNTEVGCLHCQEVYDSYQIEWREGVCDDGRVRGFWCCPTPGCGGRGFGFDIFPTDPDWVDENGEGLGWESDDGDEDDEAYDEDDEHFDQNGPDIPPELPPPDLTRRPPPADD